MIQVEIVLQIALGIVLGTILLGILFGGGRSSCCGIDSTHGPIIPPPLPKERLTDDADEKILGYIDNRGRGDIIEVDPERVIITPEIFQAMQEEIARKDAAGKIPDLTGKWEGEGFEECPDCMQAEKDGLFDEDKEEGHESPD